MAKIGFRGMSEGKIERELGKEIRESEREFKFVTS